MMQLNGRAVSVSVAENEYMLKRIENEGHPQWSLSINWVKRHLVTLRYHSPALTAGCEQGYFSKRSISCASCHLSLVFIMVERIDCYGKSQTIFSIMRSTLGTATLCFQEPEETLADHESANLP
jgi:hypothetical protein